MTGSDYLLPEPQYQALIALLQAEYPGSADRPLRIFQSMTATEQERWLERAAQETKP